MDQWINKGHIYEGTLNILLVCMRSGLPWILCVVFICVMLVVLLVSVCACEAMPVWVKRRVAVAADTQDRYLSGIRPVRFMAICSGSVHPLAIME